MWEVSRNRGAVLEEPAHGQRRSRPDGVEDSDALVLGQPHAPFGEITHIDELHRPVRTAGRKHVAAACNPAGPVREAVRRIVRAHDEPGSYTRDSTRDRLFERFLATCLERSITLVAFCERGVLVEQTMWRELSVRRDTRDEDVVGHGAAQHVRHRSNLLGSVAGGIDDCLEAAAAKRGDIPVAVAAQLLDLGKELRVPSATVKEDDVMASRKRGFDNVPTEEERSAKDEDSHASWCVVHHSCARSWVQAFAPSTSASRSDSSLADCGRSAGSFARQASTRSSSAAGIDCCVRAEGGAGGAWACCMSSPMGVSAVNTNCPVKSQYATQPVA